MEAYLRQLDIKPSDPVISVPDPSPNITLYYMHQIGFTELSNLSSPTMVQEKINQGAKYLIVNNSEALESENIKPFTTQLIGQFKDIYIFDVHRFKFYPVY